MTKNRLEASSDGGLTIMELELQAPEVQEWSRLLRLWPTLLAYVLSFISMGIYWSPHLT